MPNPPPRKRFQFHLSTAIVMMFVAGGFIWANVRPIKTMEFVNPHGGGVLLTKVYGWPIWRMIRTEGYDNNEQGSFLVSGIINGIPCLFLLFLTAQICEWLIRRRAARK